jgi:hypothetical protein
VWLGSARGNDFLSELLEQIAAPRGDAGAHAFGREPARDGMSDAHAGARHERSLVG